MSSPVLKPVEAEPLKATMQFPAAYTGPLSASFLRGAPAFSSFATRPNISRVEALRGAKGAMMAIGLEAVAAFCFYGIWQVWRIFQ